MDKKNTLTTKRYHYNNIQQTPPSNKKREDKGKYSNNIAEKTNKHRYALSSTTKQTQIHHHSTQKRIFLAVTRLEERGRSAVRHTRQMQGHEGQSQSLPPSTLHPHRSHTTLITTTQSLTHNINPSQHNYQHTHQQQYHKVTHNQE